MNKCLQKLIMEDDKYETCS